MFCLLPLSRTICSRRCLSVCLSVSNFCTKTSTQICMKFSGKVVNEAVNKWSNFGGDLDLYCDTGKTCLGGRMYCPIASSLTYIVIMLLEMQIETRFCPALDSNHNITTYRAYLGVQSLVDRPSVNYNITIIRKKLNF